MTQFEPRSGLLTFDTYVEPIGYHIDAVLGLSPTTPGKFTDLAAIVRFNADGYIDVRDGGSYRAPIAWSPTIIGGRGTT